MKANFSHLRPAKVNGASRSTVRGGQGIDWGDSLPECVAWVLVVPIRFENEKKVYLALDSTEVTAEWWE